MEEVQTVEQVKNASIKLVTSLFEAVKSGETDIDSATKAFGELVQQATKQTLDRVLQMIQQTQEPKEEPPPSWVTLPAGIVVPKGRPVTYMRFRSRWTATPKKGAPMPDKPDGGLYRWCVMWPLTDAEEEVALQRCEGSRTNRVQKELTKQAVHVIDGHVVDWGGTSNVEANIDTWWNEIGQACRGMMLREFAKMGSLSQADQIDFFENCVELRIGG